ncbi:hypothetical protein BURMUCGD2M_3948 [Burkholderia multivorans CGD2M]|nr:hypothetical protein BURMUCGD2M_3948 [Burkholderia multivorans CGD2M]
MVVRADAMPNSCGLSHAIVPFNFLRNFLPILSMEMRQFF